MVYSMMVFGIAVLNLQQSEVVSELDFACEENHHWDLHLTLDPCRRKERVIRATFMRCV